MSVEIYGVYCSAFRPGEGFVETGTGKIARFLEVIKTQAIERQHPDDELMTPGESMIPSIAEIVERGDKLTITTKRELTRDEQRWLCQRAADTGYLGVKFETGAFAPSITIEEIDEFRDELGVRYSLDMGGTPPDVGELAALLQIGKAARSLLSEINGIVSQVSIEDRAAAEATVKALEPKNPFMPSEIAHAK